MSREATKEEHDFYIYCLNRDEAVRQGVVTAIYYIRHYRDPEEYTSLKAYIRDRLVCQKGVGSITEKSVKELYEEWLLCEAVK